MSLHLTEIHVKCYQNTTERDVGTMNNSTGRSSLYAVAGAYLVYMAYELLKGLTDNSPTTMPRAVQILVIVLFTGIGITLVVFA